MARRDRSNFKTSKNQNFPDNTTGLITPEKPRNSFEDAADSVPFFVDDFNINQTWATLTDAVANGADLIFDCGVKILSFVSFVTTKTSWTLKLNNITSGGVYVMHFEKNSASDLTVTLNTDSGKPFRSIHTVGNISSLKFVGVANKNFLVKFYVSSTYIWVELCNDFHDRGAWNTTDALPSVNGSGTAGALVRNDYWIVPAGGWTYLGQFYPQWTKIECMTSGVDDFKIY